MPGKIEDSSTVFIQMVRRIFPPAVSGILLSAILAASMSTADSQLLSSASAFASDVYKPIFRKSNASDKEMFWVGRVVVLIIAVVTLLIASAPWVYRRIRKRTKKRPANRTAERVAAISRVLSALCTLPPERANDPSAYNARCIFLITHSLPPMEGRESAGYSGARGRGA